VRESVLKSNAIFNILSRSRDQSRWEEIPISAPQPLIGVDGRDNGLVVEAIAVPGKAPAYLLSEVPAGVHTIGLKFIDEKTNRSVAYIPGLKDIDSRVADWMRSSDVILLDGTCWSDDELVAQGVGHATALSMGHIAISGPNGSLAQLESFTTQRRIYIHINNTNPILDEDSDERRAVESARWEVAFDGMELEV
jgi:pyrroloquinoline quinone biosynthesis protein B